MSGRPSIEDDDVWRALGGLGNSLRSRGGLNDFVVIGLEARMEEASDLLLVVNNQCRRLDAVSVIHS